MLYHRQQKKWQTASPTKRSPFYSQITHRQHCQNVKVYNPDLARRKYTSVCNPILGKLSEQYNVNLIGIIFVHRTENVER